MENNIVDADIVERFGDLMMGRKNECPVCGKRVMWQSYQGLFGSGLGQHIRAAHPQYEGPVRAASNRRKREMAKREAEAKAEAEARPIRQHIVDGRFLDEVKGVIDGLIGMMEPYYSQGDGADRGYEMIKRIEAMHIDGYNNGKRIVA